MSRFEGLRRLFRLDRPQDVERSVDDELGFHFEQSVRELVAGGMSEPDARVEAERRFGDIGAARERLASLDRDRAFAERRAEWWSGLWQDLRYAARGLRLKPGFTLGVVLTLGLGIGANATMFGIVDRLMFQPPAYLPNADQVHRVYFVRTWDGEEHFSQSTGYKRYQDMREFTTRFSDLAQWLAADIAVGTGDESRELQLQAVSGSFWGLFDARPVIGRFFGADEDLPPTGSNVVVLDYGYWKSEYAGRTSVLGQQLRIGQHDFTIIGVAPKGFMGVEQRQASAFIPLLAGIFETGNRGGSVPITQTYSWSWPEIIARRRPGVTVAQANTDLSQAYVKSYALQLIEQPGIRPRELAKPHAVAAPVLEERGPRQSGNAKVAIWLIGVAAIVLIIACANVGNLLLARAFGRRREIAVRLALGISRSRLLAQLLTESLLLAVLGGAAGVAIAQVGGGVLRSTLIPDMTWSSTLAEPRVLLAALLLALVAGLLAGLAPLAHAGSGDLASALKAGVREGTYHRSRLRSGLLVLQGALSVVLLVGAGLFVRSFHNVQAVRLGFDSDRLLRVSLDMRGVTLPGPARDALREQLVQQAQRVPGVERAARALTTPFANTWNFNIVGPGLDTAVTNRFELNLQAASPGYLATMGTRLLRGRDLQESDGENAPKVMVVSQSMATALWPGREAIGQCFRLGQDTLPCISVVGVTEDVLNGGFKDDPGYYYTMPQRQFRPESGGLIVRTRGDATALAPAVRRALQQLMPSPAYVTVVPMSEILAPQRRQWKTGATMFTIFGVLALVVAAVGLYSVVAYGVAQRSHELGVRMALGAQVRDVIGMVVGGGLRTAAVATVLGLAGARLAGRWLAPLLFGTTPSDPVVFAGVAVLLLLIAILASAIPALRAARVDPTIALRAD